MFFYPTLALIFLFLQALFPELTWSKQKSAYESSRQLGQRLSPASVA